MRFLTDSSEADKAGDDSGRVSCPVFYGTIPGVSDPDTDEANRDATNENPDMQMGATRTSTKPNAGEVRELSGRSRAILKQYFHDTDAYTFPVGHRSVSFTEPQIDYLLRVLTDEVINMTCSTMEQLVIGAVRGKPATLTSRHDIFVPGREPKLPYHWVNFGGSSQAPESGSDATRETKFEREIEDLSSFEGSHSSTEMALIAQSFGQPNEVTNLPQTTAPTGASQFDATEGGTETAGMSSHIIWRPRAAYWSNTTLQRTYQKTAKTRRVPSRGVPMKEEFFAKIGWARFFISGPAEPLHNPHMVWCHMCKKNISIRTKGTVEILRHHRTQKNLRRDQRWRYEHIKSVNSITGKTHYRVRGRDGKL